jgi:hypothetical protein
LTARETVATETFASRATSLIVALLTGPLLRELRIALAEVEPFRVAPPFETRM